METTINNLLFDVNEAAFFDAMWRHYSILTADEYILNGRSEKWERLCEIRDEAAEASM